MAIFNFKRAKKAPPRPPSRRLEEIAPEFVANRETQLNKFKHGQRKLSRLPEIQLGSIGRQLQGLDAPPRPKAATVVSPRQQRRKSLIGLAALRAQRNEVDDPNF